MNKKIKDKVKTILILFMFQFVSCQDTPIENNKKNLIQDINPMYIFKKTDDNILLAAGDVGGEDGIFKSGDEGLTWEKISWYYIFETTDISGNIYSIYQDNILYKSTDNCISWQQIGEEGFNSTWNDYLVNSRGNIIDSRISFETTMPIIVNYIDMKSGSSSEIFNTGNKPENFIHRIYLSSMDYLYCFFKEKLYISKNNGANWSTQIFDLNYEYSYWVDMVENNNKELFLSIQDLVFYSQDFGTTWKKNQTDFGNINLKCTDEDNTIYFYADSLNTQSWKLYKTADNFKTWSNIPLPDNYSERDKLFIENGKIYLPVGYGGISISKDGGQTWIETEWYE